jgi:hemolysin III
MDASAPVHRRQSLGEEIANSISHGLGFVLSLAGAPVLVSEAARRGTLSDLVAVSVFAGTMALLYLSSTLYHALPQGRAKRAFHVLDHASIYLLIAGTYTPFTLGVLQGGWGWALFGLIWSLAVAGVLVKVFAGIRWHGISTAVYVVMGWLIVIAAKPMLELVPPAGLAWLLAGGIAYTGGVYFYAKKSLRFGHFVWHLCVVAGTGCHFVAILNYAI